MDLNFGYEEPKQEVKPEFSDEFKLELDVFARGIKGIQKIKKTNDASSAKWRFKMEYRKIQGNIEISNAELMKGPAAFEDRYKSTFGMFLPYKLTRRPTKADPVNHWRKFQLEIEEMCEIVEPENDEDWMETDRLISNIARLNTTEDKRVWADSATSDRCLLKIIDEDDGELYYCVSSDCMVSIMKDIGIKMKLQNVGDTLNARGLKRYKNKRIKVGNTRQSVWWFYANVIENIMPPEWENDEEYRKTCEEDLSQTYKDAYDGDVNAYNEVDNVLRNNPHWNCKIK